MAASERKESVQNSANFRREMDDIRKDLLLLAGSVTFLYLGLGSIEDIQRGLNDSRALNLTIRGLFIITKLISSVCLPSFLIHRLGPKLALIWAFCIHLIYLLASLDPRFSTMLVCASAAGVMNPVLWTSLGIYVTKMGVVFSRQSAASIKPLPTEAVINKFFAIFFCVVNVAFVVGSLVAAIVLNPKVEGRVTSVEDYTCGAGYCNEPLKVVRECTDLDGFFKTPSPQLADSSALTKSSSNARIKRDVPVAAKTSISPPRTTSQRPAPAIRATSPSPSPSPTPRATSAPSVIKIGLNVTIKNNPPPPPTEDLPGVTSTTTTTTTGLPPLLTRTPVPECLTNQQPAPESVYIVGGLYFLFGIGGFLIVIFLVRTLGKSPSPPLDPDEPLTRSLFSFIGSNFLLLKDYPMLLLLVLTTFGYGIVDYFFIYDYPKAYIVCIVGQHYVGFLSFCVGLLAMLSAFAFIWVHVIFCRIWMTMASTGLACICILSLFFWRPHPDTKGVAFFLSMLWGIINAIWNIQLYSIHGHLGYSKLESSFSNLIFWWTAGHLFGFIWSELVCIYFKLYIMVTFLFLASGAVVVLELILNAPHKKLTRVAPQDPQVNKLPKSDAMFDPYKSKALAAGANGQQATLASMTSRANHDPPRHKMSLPSAPLEESSLSLRPESESPYRDSPLPIQDSAMPVSDTPLPRQETPFSVPDTPLPVSATPVPISATPVPISATPAPVIETPAPPSASPVPVIETPAPTSASPVPVIETPAPTSATPVPVSSTPEPVSSTPLPASETPVPVSVTPMPVSETPAPTSATPLPVAATPAPVAETPLP